MDYERMDEAGNRFVNHGCRLILVFRVGPGRDLFKDFFRDL